MSFPTFSFSPQVTLGEQLAQVRDNPDKLLPTARSVAKSTTNVNFLRKQQFLLHFRLSLLSLHPAPTPAPPTETPHIRPSHLPPPPLPPPPSASLPPSPALHLPTHNFSVQLDNFGAFCYTGSPWPRSSADTFSQRSLIPSPRVLAKLSCSGVSLWIRMTCLCNVCRSIGKVGIFE